MDRQPRLAADADGLVDRQDQPGPFVPDVARVDPAVPGDDPGQLDQLGGLGVAAGQVNQARGHPPGPLSHPALDELLHPGQFAGVGARSALPMTAARIAP